MKSGFKWSEMQENRFGVQAPPGPTREPYSDPSAF